MFMNLDKIEAKSASRMTIGNKVIDDETAFFTRKLKSGEWRTDSLRVLVIYEIKSDLIHRVTFIRN